MEIMRQGIEDVTTRLELQQLDTWSFGRKLAYARSRQDYLVPPGLGLPTGRSPQDEVRDPLQDRRQDPWIQAKAKTEQEEVRKSSGPQEYGMTPPLKAKRLARIKKDKKSTFMMSCEGHLKELYRRLDHEYNQAHGKS